MQGEGTSAVFPIDAALEAWHCIISFVDDCPLVIDFNQADYFDK